MTSPAAGVLVDAEIFNNGMSCLSSNLHIDAKDDSSDCKFKGKVIHRPSSDYKVYVGAGANVQTEGKDATDASRYNAAAYCYGMSTWPERASPKSFYFAEDLEDVKTAMKMACQRGVSIAIRTGRHAYGCASSSTGDNIVLDVMSTFRYRSYDKETDLVTMGVSWQIGEMCEWLGGLERKDGAKGAFVPHGECAKVHIGGHAQSGGYSPFCGRSFGFFVDHIVSFKLVLPPQVPDGEPEEVCVTQPEAGKTDARNDELYWAVRGGCPGAFGVLYEITLKPLWDADYPHSRTKFWVLSYSKENLKRVLKLTLEYCAEKMPNDYNLWCCTAAGCSPFLSGNTGIDAQISKLHPDLNPEVDPTSRVIAVGATYTNLSGANRTEAEAKEVDEFFGNIDRLMNVGYGDALRLFGQNLLCMAMHPRILGFGRLLSKLLHPGESVPLSLGARVTVQMGGKRSQNNPYVLGSYLSCRSDFPEEFIHWNVDTMDEFSPADGVYHDFQWLCMGGVMNESRDNAMPHRSVQLFCFFCIHYDTVQNKKAVTEPKKLAHANMEKLQKGLIGDEERGWSNGYLQGNKQYMAFPNHHHVLDDAVPIFFDNEKTYERLLRLKRQLDPMDVLTANTWMLGATRKFASASGACAN